MIALESVNPALYGPVVTILVEADVRTKNLAVKQIDDLGDKGKPVAPLLVYILQLDDSNRDAMSHMDKQQIIECLDRLAPDMPEFSEALFNLIRPRRGRNDTMIS